MIAFTNAPLLSFSFTSRSPILTPLIAKLLIDTLTIEVDIVLVTSNVALMPVLSDVLLIFSANLPTPVPRPVDILVEAILISFTPSTLKNLRLTLSVPVSSFELSKRVRPILSDVVAPILALTVWFE